jgi:hypothetical protein
MAILTFPNMTPTKVSWKLRSNTEKFTSPLNSSTQTTARPGSRWKATIEFDDMTLERAAILDAWLASLDGMAGRFYLWPQHRPGTAGVGTVSAVTAKTISVNGLTLAEGDFIEAGGELKMITSTGNPMGIAPPWRHQPNLGAVVNATRPQSVFMLESDEYGVTRIPGLMYENIVISCVEVFQ